MTRGAALPVSGQVGVAVCVCGGGGMSGLRGQLHCGFIRAAWGEGGSKLPPPGEGSRHNFWRLGQSLPIKPHHQWPQPRPPHLNCLGLNLPPGPLPAPVGRHLSQVPAPPPPPILPYYWAYSRPLLTAACFRQ